MRVESLTRQIVAIHSQALGVSPEGVAISGGAMTSAGVAIVKLGVPGAPPCAVLKLTATAEGKRLLERETSVLSALHCDARLDGWRGLLPQPRAQGTLNGYSYRVDSALGGVPVIIPTSVDRPVLLSAAADAIAVLHTKTATTVRGGPDLSRRWVDVPMGQLLRHANGSKWISYRLETLREELHGALADEELVATWIHGDFWLGNLLFSGGRAATGIVDWEASAPLELPFHDVLHLLLYTRRLVTRCELGQLLYDHMHGGGWSSEEQAVLHRYWSWLSGVPLSPRHLLLLYWLRHVASHARQQGSQVGYRYRLWERRNVASVLAAL
jgi:hypothetical protein